MVLPGEFVAPVLQSLSDHRGNTEVVVSTTGPDHFCDEILPPSTFDPCTFGPATDLACIIHCSSALVKPAGNTEHECVKDKDKNK